MVTIAVDAMGGDHAPKSEVDGAIQAALAYNVRVRLVGREDVVRAELGKHHLPPHVAIDVVHASEVVGMDESAAKAVRSKRDSSIRVAARLVREGEADGWVSAGNTGAVMATAKMVQKAIAGVQRPALASVFPTVKGTPVVLVDVGANVDCTPEMLGQFAIMGEVYSRKIFQIRKPRVGLLSIGEEESKGNELTRQALTLMKTLPFNFIGNVEGRDLFTGHADVIVTDGFVGNVALKVSEGVADIVKLMLRESLQATLAGKLGALLARRAFNDFKRRVDYSEYGGAPLLGVKGNTIICHGRSNANAIKNAIRVAGEFASNQINRHIEEELREWAQTLEPVSGQLPDA